MVGGAAVRCLTGGPALATGSGLSALSVVSCSAWGVLAWASRRKYAST